MKKFLALTALGLLCSAAQADICSLNVVNSTCTFSTDTSGGQVLFTNPANLTNIGSGVIAPFLGTQRNGTQFGVSTDSPVVNTLPLDDKRDNANTFTNTFTQNNLGFVTVAGTTYFQFFLDINEPNNDQNRLLSLDTVRIWDAKSAALQLLTNANVGSLADVDNLFSSLIYAMGPGNTLVLNYDLFAGSGLGYDLAMLVPTSLFAGVELDSRIIFGTAFGQLGGSAESADGFEEWAYLKGNGPPPPPPPGVVPEPTPLALAGIGLLALGITARRKQQISK